MNLPFVTGALDWLKSQVILFAIFTPIFLIFKYVISSIFNATAEHFDNTIVRLSVRLLLPGLVGLGIAYLTLFLHCAAATKFILFIAMSVGGIVTYLFLLLFNSFIHIPFFTELTTIFLILIVLSLLDNILPIFMPEFSIIFAIIFPIIQLVIIYVYAGSQLAGITGCFVHGVKGKVIPGTGGISIGA